MDEALSEGALAGSSPGGGGSAGFAIEDLALAARRGEAAALAVYDTFADWLALGLANLVNIVDPEVVLIGGGLATASELYLRQTRESLARRLYDSAGRPVVIDVAQLGEEAAAVGAGLLAVDARGSSGSS